MLRLGSATDSRTLLWLQEYNGIFWQEQIVPFFQSVKLSPEARTVEDCYLELAVLVSGWEGLLRDACETRSPTSADLYLPSRSRRSWGTWTPTSSSWEMRCRHGSSAGCCESGGFDGDGPSGAFEKAPSL